MKKNKYMKILILVLFLTTSIIIVQFTNKKDNRTPNSILLTLTEENEQLAWKNLKLLIGQQDGPGDHVSIPNHSEITNTETISLPVGKATLIRFLHGGSAVHPVPDKIMYWIYVKKPISNKPDLMRTYYLEGEVIGNNEQLAKDELIQIAQTWKIK